MKTKKTTARSSAGEMFQHDCDNAKKCYSRARDGIIEAIAYAFRVYRATENSSNAATKIENEIATRNSRIADYNKGQQDDRARATELAAGKLAVTDLGKDEIARLKGIAALSDDAWRVRYIKLPIEATDDNACLRIVKHLFDLDRRVDHPNASRYKTAVLWVDDNCSESAGVTDIVTAIKGAGGLDCVIELYRLANKSEGGAGSDVQTKAGAADVARSNKKSKRSSHRAAFNRAKPIAWFKAAKIKAQPNDLFLLVGRYRKGKVQIVKSVPLSDEQLDAAVEIINAAPATEAAESEDPRQSATRAAA